MREGVLAFRRPPGESHARSEKEKEILAAKSPLLLSPVHTQLGREGKGREGKGREGKGRERLFR